MSNNRKIATIKASKLLGIIDIEWSLRSGVNILSGYNGCGKSTLLKAISLKLVDGSLPQNLRQIIESVNIESCGEAVRADDVLVLNRNLDGFLTIGSPVEGVSEQRCAIFYDIVDKLFELSRKKVDRQKGLDNLTFNLEVAQGHTVVVAYEFLSAGEKLAVSLFKAILLRPNASVLVVDEPEVSLSLEWQKSLLDDILALNSDMQIIIATHSPAIILRGWLDCVTEIEDRIQFDKMVN